MKAYVSLQFEEFGSCIFHHTLNTYDFPSPAPIPPDNRDEVDIVWKANIFVIQQMEVSGVNTV